MVVVVYDRNAAAARLLVRRRDLAARGIALPTQPRTQDAFLDEGGEGEGGSAQPLTAKYLVLFTGSLDRHVRCWRPQQGL